MRAEAGNLYIHESGTGKNPVLLLHGLNESTTGYGAAIKHLEDRCRLIALDFRGHGRSRWSSRYRLSDYVADAVSVIEDRIGDPVVLAGHSLGGLVAAWIAVLHPEKVKAVLLEDPPIYTAQMPTIKETPFHTIFSYLRGALEQHQASRGTSSDMKQIVSEWRVGDEGSPTLLEHFGSEFVTRMAADLHSTDPRTLDPVLDGTLFDGFEPDRDLPKISCPTRLIAGNPALGAAMRAQDVARVASLIPRCSEVVWEDVGHDIHTVRPEAYAEELIAQIDRVPESG